MSSAAIALVTVTAYAASSGNFTAGVNNAKCTINSSTGGFATGSSSSSASGNLERGP